MARGPTDPESHDSLDVCYVPLLDPNHPQGKRSAGCGHSHNRWPMLVGLGSLLSEHLLPFLERSRALLFSLGLFAAALAVVGCALRSSNAASRAQHSPFLPSIPPSETIYDSPRATRVRNFVPSFAPLEADFRILLKNMTLDESKLWTQLCHIHANLYRGQPIGARHPQARFGTKHTTTRAVSHSELPSSTLELDPVYRGGSRAKHYALLSVLRKAVNGEFTRGGHCSSSLNWMKQHANLQREILSGQRAPRVTSFITIAGNTWGLADRLMGMLTFAAYSIVYDRAWVASWEAVVLPEFVYDSPWADWSFPDSDSAKRSHRLFGDQSLTSHRATLNWIGWTPSIRDKGMKGYNWTSGLSEAGESMRHLTPAFKSDWLEVRGNRGLARWFFQSESGRQALKSKGLYEETIYACLMDYLFRPRAEILEFTAPLVAYFSLPTVFSVGIHVRTDDGEISGKGKPHSDLSEFDHYFQCALNLSKRFATEDQKVTFFLMADSQRMKDEAKKKYGSLVITSNQVPRHVDLDPNLQGNMVVAAELDILRITDYRILTTCSGLGSLGALTSPHPLKTVALTNKAHVDSQRLVYKHPACSQKAFDRISKNCMLDDAFISMDELASTWSLA